MHFLLCQKKVKYIIKNRREYKQRRNTNEKTQRQWDYNNSFGNDYNNIINISTE